MIEFTARKDKKSMQYYKILIMFKRGEKITQKRLLKLNGVTTELLDECLKLGLLVETDKTDVGDIRYTITEKGMDVRDGQ